jgi:hypothetical protein
MSHRRRNVRCQWVHGCAHLGPESVHIILCSSHTVTILEYLQVDVQLWEVRHGGHQRGTGFLMNLVSSHGINPTLEQLYYRKHGRRLGG